MAKNHYNTTGSYNYGSTAPKIYTDVPVPKPPVKEKPRKSSKERKAERKENFKHSFSRVLSFTAIFVASITFVWGCAVVAYKQDTLKQTKSEIRDLQSQINTTKALIASSTNLDHIKERAIQELNMNEPLTHQIILLDIAKTSYTVTE